jgi:hypothetical protein
LKRVRRSPDRLDPREDLLDAFADLLADGVSAMSRRSPIDRRATALVLNLRDRLLTLSAAC